MVRIEMVSDFYSTIEEWLNNHDWPIIPESALPKKVFILKNKDETDSYCCFLYETDSDFGFLGFPISNKEVERNNEDLAVLFNEVEQYAKSTGIKIILTTSGTPVVMDKLLDSGYIIQDKNVNQYIRWVNS